MANLLNALPQTAASSTPAELNPLKGKDQNQANAKDLKKQFDAELSDQLNDQLSEQESAQETLVSSQNAAQLAAAHAAAAQALTQSKGASVKSIHPQDAQQVPQALQAQNSKIKQQLEMQAALQAAAQVLSTSSNQTLDVPAAAQGGTQTKDQVAANAQANVQSMAGTKAKPLAPSVFQVNPLPGSKAALAEQALAPQQNLLTPAQQAQLQQVMAQPALAQSAQSQQSAAAVAAHTNSALMNSGVDASMLGDVDEVSVEPQGGVRSSSLSTDSFLNLREISQPKLNSQAQTVNGIHAKTNAQNLNQQDVLQQNLAQMMNSQGLNKPLQSGMPTGVSIATATGVASGVGMNAITGKKQNSKNDENARAQDAIASISAGVMLDKAGSPSTAKVIDAPVTQGTNQTLTLSHDALNRISNQVAQFNQNQQNGEIKIRLRPDHLGELQMSVKTVGKNVTIQIKAQDAESKRIIESSLGSLKDNLAQQSLTLGKMDVMVQAPALAQQGMNSGFNADSSQSGAQQNGFSMNMDPGAQGSASQQGESYKNDRGFGSEYASDYRENNVASKVGAGSGLWTRPKAANQRLDLIA